MATPSSRPNPGATPTHLTSSPRPSGPLPRPASHKSPSTRTPSAFQGPPTSSNHLYATPLVAAGGVIDDPVTFSSPSALLALSGYAGITPSPAGHDGLVAAAGMNESDIQALGMHGLKLGGPRDSDEERRRNIDHVVQLLRTRVAGRGVCREGIERLSQLEGFESIWQEDSLNIAGNFVDLEIEFHRRENTISDVSLKYATPEATEGERREEATAVLKRGLIQPSEDAERGAWKSLTGFHENLQWLARHDRLSQEVNCFEAIEGLYESLRRVWDAEGAQGKTPGVYERLCQASVGRPFLHQEGRIGLGLDYWVWQARVVDAQCKKNKGSDDMEIDQSEDVPESLKGRWSVAVECEEGYPSLRVSKEWVGPEPLTQVDNAADEADMVVNWTDPPATIATNSEGHPDAMALDANMLGSAPNRRFVARLEPPLDVPIIVGSDIYRQLGFDIPQEFRVVTYDGITYDGLLAPGWSPVSAATAMGLGLEDAYQLGRKRRRMSVSAVDVDGKPYKKWHTYTFQPFESTQGRTIRDIVFAHPRQLAEIFPVCFPYYGVFDLNVILTKMLGSASIRIPRQHDPLHLQQRPPRGDPAGVSQRVPIPEGVRKPLKHQDHEHRHQQRRSQRAQTQLASELGQQQRQQQHQYQHQHRHRQ